MQMRRLVGWVGVAVFVGSAGAAERGLLGFVDERAGEQVELEARFDAELSADRVRDRMKRLTAHPHHTGSPYGKANAHWIASEFEKWGYRTKIEVFHVLFPTPKVRLLEMVEPERFNARLTEPALGQDSTSDQRPQQLPAYNAYSPDGDVTAELVYVNQGLPADYEDLSRRGIDVSGKIVIARYGGSWRGIKPKIAAQHGAVACILYSDPRGDGFFQGDVYPKGAFKSSSGVQRGSVADMPLFPGDPLTPGVGATKDATRLELADAPTLSRIPVMPISHGDALPLLRALAGPVAPERWRGALPITYHMGPGPAKVHIKLEFNWDTVPAYDVIATLPGETHPDQWILRGNHHDAWVNGANDPISGLASMMEEARAIGMLAADGWRPRRTILYAAWDAEEPGLLGSTEWVETHAAVLRQRAAVYINTDSNGRGFLRAGGSHTLEAFFNQVAADVVDPQKGISVADRARAYRLVRGNPAEQLTAAERKDLQLSALGSGSDYTPFLQHLGIASLNVGYGGENRGGEYHSIYDSFDHYRRFGDPGFHYGVTLAQTTGRAVLRLAEADLLPFEFKQAAETFSRYVDELTQLIDTMREQTERENRLIREGHYDAVADPTRAWVTPDEQDPVPVLSLAPLREALAKLHDAALVYGGAVGTALSGAMRADPAQLARVDVQLAQTERSLTREEGLPGRPWFTHHIYAPGYLTGYGVKTLPGVREAIEEREWALAEEQIAVAAQVVEAFAVQINRSAAPLVH